MSSNPTESFINYRDIDTGNNPSGETNVDEAKIYGSSKYIFGTLKKLMQVKPSIILISSLKRSRVFLISRNHVVMLLIVISCNI